MRGFAIDGERYRFRVFASFEHLFPIVMSPYRSSVIIGLLSLALPWGAVGGCNGLKSRYAMSDPVYAEKYADGAEPGDWVGKAKQALDARHVAGLQGLSVGGGAMYRPKSDHTLGGAEFSLESYRQNWLSYRGGLATYISDEEGYVGLDGGVRAQFPSRITPFVGVGSTIGASRTVRSSPDGLDNDDDGRIDEPGESYSEIDDFLIAVYPEVGVHAWLNGRWRATVSARYFETNLSRQYDDWMLGGQLTYFPQRTR